MTNNNSDAATTEKSEIIKSTPEFLTETRFDQLNLPPVVMKGIEDAGFSHCSPIQAQVLPITLEGKDIAGQAQTGTGKTAAFLVSLFTRMQHLKIRNGKNPTALVIAPTRELASQIMEEAKVLGGMTAYRIIQIIGGIDYDKQAKQLRDGVDIVICTPGRVIDYIKQNIFKTSAIKVLVIDEADRLLDLGFEKDMRFLLKRLPKYDRRQSMLFSATLSYRVLELTYEYMNLPEFVAVAPEKVTVKGIDQILYHVGLDEKLPLLLGLLKREKWHRLLIFMNTKVGVEWLAAKLKGNGWPAEGITGDLQQRKRFRLMEQFKSGKLKILIATDVASRGLHVDDISHVINYDLPQDAENYVHRIGRTARAGTTGRAISLACERYVYHLEPIETVLTDKIPVEWTDETVFEKDTAGPIKVASSKPRPKRSGGRPQRKSPPTGARKTTRFPDREAIRQRLQNGYFPGTFFGFQPLKKTASASSKKTAAPSKDRQPRKNKKTQDPGKGAKHHRPEKKTEALKPEKNRKSQPSAKKTTSKKSMRSTQSQKSEKIKKSDKAKESTKGQRSTKKAKPQKPVQRTKAQKPVKNTATQKSEKNTKRQSSKRKATPKKPTRRTKTQKPEKDTKTQHPDKGNNAPKRDNRKEAAHPARRGRPRKKPPE